MTVKKHDRALPDVTADYAGIELPDRYVFGFGMDVNENPALRAGHLRDEGITAQRPWRASAAGILGCRRWSFMEFECNRSPWP